MIDLEDYKQYGSFVLIVVAFVLMMISGVYFGVIYYMLDATQTAFESTDCVIDNNNLVSSCQELFQLALYPFLELREILVWVSFFIIFGLTLGILMAGYQSGRSPTLMGLLFLFLSVLTYIAIELSNKYKFMLSNTAFQEIMVEFTVYNRLMLSLPWYIFIVSLFSVMVSIVNFQRTRVNEPNHELDY
jgi:hypothetical protein